MYTKCQNKFLAIGLIFMSTTGHMYAQGGNQDFLRSTGKIYGVIAAVVLIFIGIAFYLWRLDNKLTKLEKQIKQGE